MTMDVELRPVARVTIAKYSVSKQRLLEQMYLGMAKMTVRFEGIRSEDDVLP